MANIYKALPHFLEADGTLFSLLSSRIYPNTLPPGENTLPAIVFQDISTVAIQTHRERSVLPTKRFQFTIYAGSISAVDGIAVALKNRLDGYRGQMGTGSYLTEVEAVLFKNEISNNDTDTHIQFRYQDYTIQYKE